MVIIILSTSIILFYCIYSMPAVYDISTTMGFAGDALTITGTCFSNRLSEVNVYFLQNPCSNVSATVVSVSATQIHILVPDCPAGIYRVGVSIREGIFIDGRKSFEVQG